MKLALIFLVILVLLSISILHFYWAFGGKWGIETAMPQQYKADYFNPKHAFKIKLATIVVALGLIVFSTIVASNYFDFSNFLTQNYSILGTRMVAGVFIIRAIGDFNLFGFFKKPSEDNFAKSDTKIYIPICLFLGTSLILISIL